MFERGGNAVDAAVAAALVAGVAEPAETTLAGGGFMLSHDPRSGPCSVEFGPRAPLAAHPTMFDIDPQADSGGVVCITDTVGQRNLNGALASGVPRTLLGLLTAQENLGKLSRRDVMQPAIDLAHDGFQADSWFVTSVLADLHRLRTDPAASEAFLEDGLPKGGTGGSALGLAGGPRARVRQPRLGATLDEVALGGLRTLIDGDIATRLIASSTERGGLLSAADLAAAGPEIRRPAGLDFRDSTVYVPGAPCGGRTLLQILAIWSALHARGTTGRETPEHAKSLALTIRHAFADRYHWLGDPDHVVAPEAEVVSESYAAELAELCRRGVDVDGWHTGLPWAVFAGRAAHEPWGADDDAAPHWSPLLATTPTSGTTHISAAGADGHVVSITHTAAHHFGSGVMCPRTGLLFDAAMAWFNAAPGAANSIAAGKRPQANMCPALVIRPDGRAVAVGASGGRRIISAIAQVVINLIDGDDDIATALDRPRLDASGPVVELDDRRDHDLDAMGALGAKLIPTMNDPYVMDLARPNAAASTSGGQTASAISSQNYSE